MRTLGQNVRGLLDTVVGCAVPWVVALLAVVLFSSSVASAQGRPLAIPPELEPWAAWVLHDEPDLVCTVMKSGRACVWPGRLDVRVAEGGASFSMVAYADREIELSVPGGPQLWPQSVSVDGRAATVVAVDGTPAVVLPAGSHRIAGTFSWDSVPEVLPVPRTIGQVSLTLSDGAVEFPRVDAEGRLWLGEGGGESVDDETDTVRASVYRSLRDGVPLQIVTRLRLNVSGKARDVELGKVLIEGSLPTAIRAQLPVRVGADGVVTVYVRPGTHDIDIDAVVATPAKSIKTPTPTPNFYDPQEVWVWIPDEIVRSVALDGLAAVDPERTTLPDEWKGNTTFLAEPGKALTLTETRRGVTEAPPNLLNVDREFWLDLDGSGYTVRDQLSGTMNQGWRLNYAGGSGVLGRVSQRGQNLLITNEPGTDVAGVELRDQTVDLTAEVRLDDVSRDIDIVGWDHDVQRLSARLHLPPGWFLVGGRGVDKMRGTWLESWDLLSMFFVLIVAFVIVKLSGWQWGLIAGCTLVLAHGEPGAPKWVWVHLLATLALLRVLPNGWVRKTIVVYRSAALLFLAVTLLPFAREQFQTSLHPQVGSTVSFSQSPPAWLQEEASELEFAADKAAGGAPMAEEAPMDEMDDAGGRWADVEKPSPRRRKGVLGKLASSDSMYGEIQLQQIDPKAVVQTGPGLPTWTWNTWELEWTGPVRRDHKVSLFLVSPTVNVFLTFLRVGFLLLLALLMLSPRDMYWNRRRRLPGWWISLFGSGAAVTLAASVSLLLLPVSDAAAEEIEFQQSVAGEPSFPSPVLEQLRQRLVQARACEAPCVTVSRADIVVDALEFSLRAEVHARQPAAWAVPGPDDPLRLDSVRIDGIPTTQLRRVPDGLTWVRVPAGRHVVEVEGRLRNRNVVTVHFSEETRPRFMTFQSDDWSYDGISPVGVPDGSLQLTRRADAVDGVDNADARAQELPPWFHVDRRIALGLPWQVHTTVSRLDGSRPQLVKVPLLPGEKVITDGVRMEGATATVDFPRGVTEVTYSGEIPITDTVKLTASSDGPWTEDWTVDCSRIWSCSFSGISAVTEIQSSVFTPKWKPWPGESLQIEVDRPTGAPGAPRTVESVDYVVRPGKRLMQATLTLVVRASQGTVQEVTLPGEAQLQSVLVDGRASTIRVTDGVVRLPVQPGQNRFELAWQQPWDRHFQETVPAVNIGSAAVNARVTIERGEERWLLGVGGPLWGPAILFWSHLTLLLLMALLLGLLRRLPVSPWQWLFLAIGMSQLPVPAMIPIVAWFLLVEWRGREEIEAPWRFNVTQLAIIGLTFIAVGTLYAAVHTNLLIEIDMQVDGMGSTNDRLIWYVDQVDGALPTPTILSLPIVVYRVVMFVWALWLVSRIIAWARWGWAQFSRGGRWRTPVRKPRKPRPGPPKPPRAREEDVEEDPPDKPARHAVDGKLVRAEFDLDGTGASVPQGDGGDWGGDPFGDTPPKGTQVDPPEGPGVDVDESDIISDEDDLWEESKPRALDDAIRKDSKKVAQEEE